MAKIVALATIVQLSVRSMENLMKLALFSHFPRKKAAVKRLVSWSSVVCWEYSDLYACTCQSIVPNSRLLTIEGSP